MVNACIKSVLTLKSRILIFLRLYCIYELFGVEIFIFKQIILNVITFITYFQQYYCYSIFMNKYNDTQKLLNKASFFSKFHDTNSICFSIKQKFLQYLNQRLYFLFKLLHKRSFLF